MVVTRFPPHKPTRERKGSGKSHTIPKETKRRVEKVYSAMCQLSQRLTLQRKNSGVDWRWFQLGLISQITRVRVSPPPLIQEKMKLDAIISETLVGALEALNDLKVTKENIVSFFQDKEGQYVAIFYT